MSKLKMMLCIAAVTAVVCIQIPAAQAACKVNGVLEGNERCDGTKFKNNLTCKAFTYKNALGKLEKFTGGTLKCTKTCNVDISGCKKNFCGDGVIGGTEKCEWKGLGGATCQSLGFDGGTLKCNAYICQYNTAGCYKLCGNGKVDASEQCDSSFTGGPVQGATCMALGYGFMSGKVGCTPQCTFDVSLCKGTAQDPYGAAPPLQLPTCGNWKIDIGEVCDSNNVNNVDGKTCKSIGYFGGSSLTCSPNCQKVVTTKCYGWGTDPYGVPQTPDYQPACGNGYLDSGEVCDSGAILFFDLSKTYFGKPCKELGYFGGTVSVCNQQCTGYDESVCYGWGKDPYATPQSPNYQPGCGSGTIDPGEVCDPKNPPSKTKSCELLGYFGGEQKCNATCSGYTCGKCYGWGSEIYGTPAIPCTTP